MKNIKTIIAAACLLMNVSMYAINDARSLYEQGMEAFRSGNYGSSELLFRKIVDSDDDDFRDKAWFFLARSIYNKKKYKLALFEFNNFLNKCKTDTLAVESRYWIGETYYQLKEYNKAIESYRRYVLKNREGNLVTSAHDRIGRMYYLQSRYDEAIIEWERAIEREIEKKNNAIRLLWIGEAQFVSKNYDESLGRLKPLLSLRLDAKLLARARIIIGQIYLKKGNHHQALYILRGITENLIKVYPFYDAQFLMAKCYIYLGNKNRAQTLLDLFLLIGKKSQWYHNAMFELAQIYLDRKEIRKGIEYLEIVRKSAPQEALRSEASKIISGIYIKENPEKAIPYLIESLSVYDISEKKERLILLGSTYIRIRKFEKAGAIFDNYLSAYPYDSKRDKVKFLRARVYLAEGDTARAMEIFNEIKKENPFSKYNKESYYHLALINYSKGNFNKTVFLINEYLKQDKTQNVYDAHLLLLDVYLKLNDMTRAEKIIEQIIKNYLNFKDVDVAIKKYAIVLWKTGKDYERYFNILISRFPKSESTMNIYNMLGDTNFKKKEYKTAISYYNKYLESGFKKKRGNAFYRKIISLYTIGNYKDVVSLIEQGNFPPMDENQWKKIPLMQARSYYYLKNYVKVYMIMDHDKMASYSKRDILMFIKCSLNVGDMRSALEASDLLENDRNLFAEALFIIGKAYLKGKNRDEADLFFMKIISECPRSKYVDYAKVSLSRMYMDAKKYQAAMRLLADVKVPEQLNVKRSMFIEIFFETGRNKEAIALTKEYLSELLKSPYGEPVIKLNVAYYYNQKNLTEFNTYIRYLKRYSGNDNYILYLSGKLHYQMGKFQKSYYEFYRLSKVKSRYQAEALYHMASYNLFILKNRYMSIAYFKRLAKMNTENKVVKYKSIIHLAVIYHELNNVKKAREYLEIILKSDQRGLFFNQAKNLHEELLLVD